MYNYMVDQLQMFKLQMQPQAMPVSDFSLAKVTTKKIFVSADLAIQMQPQAVPVSDLSLAKVNTKKIFVSADLEIQMQPQAVPVSDISLAKVTTEKIFVSADLDPVQEIARVFSETSNHDSHT